MARISLRRATEEVAGRDLVMGAFIERAGPMKLRASRGTDVFTALAQSMIEVRQTPSTAVVTPEKKRFLEFFSVVPGKGVKKSAG